MIRDRAAETPWRFPSDFGGESMPFRELDGEIEERPDNMLMSKYCWSFIDLESFWDLNWKVEGAHVDKAKFYVCLMIQLLKYWCNGNLTQ